MNTRDEPVTSEEYEALTKKALRNEVDPGEVERELIKTMAEDPGCKFFIGIGGFQEEDGTISLSAIPSRGAVVFDEDYVEEFEKLHGHHPLSMFLAKFFLKLSGDTNEGLSGLLGDILNAYSELEAKNNPLSNAILKMLEGQMGGKETKEKEKPKEPESFEEFLSQLLGKPPKHFKEEEEESLFE